jgi:2,3-bisphosphoglycerate-independent phosphoglycerate mutase
MKIPFVALVIMDGWGIAPPGEGNAISQDTAPNIFKLSSSFPHATLLASGEAVGLPKGEVGNTETGHLNLGAGRIVYQDLLRINRAIDDGSFFRNQVLIQAIEHVKKNRSRLHVMGLVGASGVHASLTHLFAILILCKRQGLSDVFIHAFTDGRDTPPKSAIDYITMVENFCKKEQVGKIVSVVGRYFAMDRDLRWERTKIAYEALTAGAARIVSQLTEGIRESYDKNITDEFIQPIMLKDSQGKPYTIGENDAVIFFNFRIDRPRQLTKAFVLEDFENAPGEEWGFDPYLEHYYKKQEVVFPPTKPFLRGPKIKNLFFVTMTEYDKSFGKYVHVAFPPEIVKLPIGEVLANQQMRQLRIAESEKERFVTFYFNGQRELAFPGETRIIVPSPKVPTYDKKPEMSAFQVADAVVQNIGSEPIYPLIVVNFANPDMVGHTGNIQASKKAVATVDQAVLQIVEKVSSLGGVTVITADHGNVEELLTADGGVDTEHSKNPVPFIIVGPQFVGNDRNLGSGILGDVAPTVLKLLGIPKPSEMTGRSLV